MDNSFGRHLKAAIVSRGLRQWQVCQQVGWKEARLSGIVTGRLRPSPEELEALSSVLQVPMEELQAAEH